METPPMNSKRAPLHLDERTWIRMGRLYRRFPFLSNDVVVRILLFLFAGVLAILLARMEEPCTCADQIADEQLKSIVIYGDSAVVEYMQSEDDAIICAAKRQELLKKLKKKKN